MAVHSISIHFSISRFPSNFLYNVQKHIYFVSNRQKSRDLEANVVDTWIGQTGIT